LKFLFASRLATSAGDGAKLTATLLQRPSTVSTASAVAHQAPYCRNINPNNQKQIDISTMTTSPFPLLPGQALAALGQRVALARRARQLSQRDLAFLAGVGASSIVALEKGHPGVALGTLARVLDALGLLAEIDQLLPPQRDPALVQHAVRSLQK
jgi:DNA-binding XRE family transcriptional regulator